MTFRFSVIIPIKNEAENILSVISDLDNVFNDSEFLVVLGDSSDRTDQVIKGIRLASPGNILRVLRQRCIGKAGAVWTGVNYATGRVLIVYDGDRTIEAQDALKIAKETEKTCCLAIADRLGCREKGAMPFTNFLYNKIMSLIFFLLFQKKVGDLFAGCKAFPERVKTDLFKLRYFYSKRDQWSDLQMLAAACTLDIEVRSISVVYKRRLLGKSKIIKSIDGINLFRFLVDCSIKKICQSSIYKRLFTPNSE